MSDVCKCMEICFRCLVSWTWWCGEETCGSCIRRPTGSRSPNFPCREHSRASLPPLQTQSSPRFPGISAMMDADWIISSQQDVCLLTLPLLHDYPVGTCKWLCRFLGLELKSNHYLCPDRAEELHKIGMLDLIMCITYDFLERCP